MNDLYIDHAIVIFHGKSEVSSNIKINSCYALFLTLGFLKTDRSVLFSLHHRSIPAITALNVLTNNIYFQFISDSSK